MNQNSSYYFLLGGNDAEMEAIRGLLDDHGYDYEDKSLGWGAKASSYLTTIETLLSAGKKVFLVELEPDLPPSILEQVQFVDHHNEKAGKDAPCSLQQTAEIIGVSPTEFAANRFWQLIAANDTAHIRGMRSLRPPATDKEILSIRKLDLECQGTTKTDFEQAKLAINSRREQAGGGLTTVQISSDRTSLIAEVMEPFFSGPGFQNLLVVGETEVAFFGAGSLVAILIDHSPPSPASWSGGALPEFGFWGAVKSSLGFDPVELLLSELS